MKCTECGKLVPADSWNEDVCNECVNAFEEDVDREMLGDDYDHFKNSGYFEEHGHFGNK